MKLRNIVRRYKWKFLMCPFPRGEEQVANVSSINVCTCTVPQAFENTSDSQIVVSNERKKSRNLYVEKWWNYFRTFVHTGIGIHHHLLTSIGLFFARRNICNEDVQMTFVWWFTVPYFKIKRERSKFNCLFVDNSLANANMPSQMFAKAPQYWLKIE